ncbi:hypothetical protein ACFFRR_008296 [Megaselia abdita]
MVLKLKRYLSFVFTLVILFGGNVFGTKFERKIFNVLSKEKSQENLIFSPISIEVALALGYFATRGDTRREIGDLLDLQTDSSVVEKTYDNLIDGASEKYNMSIVNKIWLKNSLEVRSRFQEIAKRSFNSEVSNVDFGDSAKVVDDINSWIDEATHHTIQDVISKDAVNQNTLLVLLNAVYFKGQWENTFKLFKKPGRFYNHGQTIVPVNQMSTSRNILYGELKEIDAVAVEIPYKTNGLSMLILLPKETNGLPDMEDKLASLDVLELVKNRLFHRTIKVILPKFTINSDMDLVRVLSKVGVHKIFTSSADFSGLLSDSDDRAKVSSAKHTAFIEVNEVGTEASASTRIHVMAVSSSDKFTVDHPFIYLIKDQEKIYFMGHVVEL